jgi:hypothetical protein
MFDIMLTNNKIKKLYKPYQKSLLIYSFVIHYVVTQMLDQYGIVPEKYRILLSRITAKTWANDFKLDVEKTACENFHEKCDGSVQMCHINNLKKFIYIYDKLARMYGKVYIISLIIAIYNKKNIFNVFKKYIKSTTTSALSLSTHIYIYRTYVTVVQHMQPEIKTKKYHYGNGILLGSIAAYLIEDRYRSGIINKYMMSMAIHTLIHQTYPNVSQNPKILLCWKAIFTACSLGSIYKQGIIKTSISLL